MTLKRANEDNELDEVLSAVALDSHPEDEEEILLIAGESPPRLKRPSTLPTAQRAAVAAKKEKKSAAGLWTVVALLVIAGGVVLALNWDKIGKTGDGKKGEAIAAKDEPTGEVESAQREKRSQPNRELDDRKAEQADAAKKQADAAKKKRDAAKKAHDEARTKEKLARKQAALRKKLKLEKEAAEKRVVALRAATHSEADALDSQITEELAGLAEVEKGLAPEDVDGKTAILGFRAEGEALAASLAAARKALAAGTDEAAFKAVDADLASTRAKVTDYRARAGKLTETVLVARKFTEGKAALVSQLSEAKVLDAWGGALDGLLARSVEGLDPKKNEEKARLDAVQAVRDSLAAERKTFLDMVASVEALDAPEKLAEVTEASELVLQTLETRVTALKDEQWSARNTGLQELAGKLAPLPERIDEKVAFWQKIGDKSAAREQATLAKEKLNTQARSRTLEAFHQKVVPEELEEWLKHIAAVDRLFKDGDDDLRRVGWLLRKEPVDENQQALDSMDGDLCAMNTKLKHRLNKLEAKSNAWKKAGDGTRGGEIDGMIKELNGIRVTAVDVRKVVKKSDLAIAKTVFVPLYSQYKEAMAKTAPVVNEKVTQAGGAGAKGDAQAALKAISCPGGMKRMIVKNPKAKKNKKAASHVGFCIDYYEYPGKGSKPKTNVSWQAARAACASKGKRLCSNWEWRRGCGAKYSYGKTYDPDRCNTVDEEGMERPILPAGSKPQCRSGYGLYDMIGNVAEWTEEKTVNGGDSYKTADDATCWRSAKRFGASRNVGFRCCADLK